jgi:hypothetical protein
VAYTRALLPPPACRGLRNCTSVLIFLLFGKIIARVISLSISRFWFNLDVGRSGFGERFYATTDGITSIDDFFPEEDFFPDISSLYIDDMADTNANANANLNANTTANLNVNVNPPAAPYAICSYLFQFLL